MFEKVDTEIIGIVENMSYFICPKCGNREEIFSYGGGKKTADELGTSFLGELPIDAKVTETGDSGEPIIISEPKGEHAQRFNEMADKVIELVNLK